jgi:hypothetical protein
VAANASCTGTRSSTVTAYVMAPATSGNAANECDCASGLTNCSGTCRTSCEAAPSTTCTTWLKCTCATPGRCTCASLPCDSTPCAQYCSDRGYTYYQEFDNSSPFFGCYTYVCGCCN